MCETEICSLFFPFMLEQISVPALNTCAKILREGNGRAKTLLLQALIDIHQSEPMRLNMRSLWKWNQ